MSTLTPPRAAGRPVRTHRQLTQWSLLVVPAFVLVFWLTDVVGTFLMLPLLGLHEGDLPLMARDVAGWTVTTLLFLVAVAAPALGMGLARAALRRGGRAGAWAALVLNAGTALLMVYVFADAVRMTYFPEVTGPFGG
ncbi:hypothetical protein ACFUC1_17025 [Pedococcus sp. NPDC057267]|uniref:hypothetical protein n=1 Tax=Pedococcus sp. NPDC057267 TaxID=3346077 RepID=UPI003636FAF4